MNRAAPSCGRRPREAGLGVRSRGRGIYGNDKGGRRRDKDDTRQHEHTVLCPVYKQAEAVLRGETFKCKGGVQSVGNVRGGGG